MPVSSMALAAFATIGVTDWAEFACVWMARLTSRWRASSASRSMPARTSSVSQNCGRPISALVASRMSRTLGMPSSSVTKDSSRGQGRFATSPPETTTSRTPGEWRR